MTKMNSTDAYPTNNESPAPSVEATPDAATATTPSFWRLKDATAPKLGARAEGGIRYHVLADINRQQLYIAIAGNGSGGYFSRERVPFDKIEACLDSIPSGKSLPSKAFKETFIGRSSNNAGFLVAVLRFEGLLAAASGTESQHVRHGDTATWKKAMFSQEGTLIAPSVVNGGGKQGEDVPLPDNRDHKKILTIPSKKTR